MQDRTQDVADTAELKLALIHSEQQLDEALPAAVSPRFIKDIKSVCEQSYQAQDIPYIYKGPPHKVVTGDDGQPAQSELWIASSDAIHNLDADWRDHIPEVLAQWRGLTREGQQGAKIGRLEKHQLEDGSFVLLDFKNVSEMGAFDGELERLSHYVPSGSFNPNGSDKVRKSYRVLNYRKVDQVPDSAEYIRDKTGQYWIQDSRFSVTGTAMLNGYAELLNFHIGGIEKVQSHPKLAFRYQQLPITDATEEQSTTASELVVYLEQQRERMLELSSASGPLALRALLVRGNYGMLRGAATDGILNHPDKIDILGVSLAEFSRAQRFHLAQFVAQSLMSGEFEGWLRDLVDNKSKAVMSQVVERNTDHLTNWFIRGNPNIDDVSGWIERAESTVASGFEDHTREFEKILNGFQTSLMGRYVEHCVVKYLSERSGSVPKVEEVEDESRESI